VERTAVDSSNLAFVWYDEGSCTLGIEFKSGMQYEYYDVPTAVVNGLVGASSKGEYFNANIRGKFRYARI
jgi:hypothetical protein